MKDSCNDAILKNCSNKLLISKILLAEQSFQSAASHHLEYHCITGDADTDCARSSFEVSTPQNQQMLSRTQ